MKLATQLIVGPVVAAFVAVAAIGAGSALSAGQAAQAEARHAADLVHLRALDGAKVQLGTLHAGVYRTVTLIASLEDERVRRQRDRLRAELQAVKLSFAALASAGDAELDSGSARAALQVDKYLQAADQAVDLASVDPNTGIAALQAADDRFADLAATAGVLAARVDAISAARTSAADAQARTQQALTLVLALLAVGGVVGGTWIVLRRIVGDLAKAGDAAQAVADGHLDRPVDTARADEVGDMLRALERMRLQLGSSLRTVRETADSIRTASDEVATGNADLSQRTEHAAANLQQTASSMEQITGTVRQSSDAAAQANQLAASASAVARRGGTVVAEVVATMQEINTSSRRIADIIGVIDGIAFQTNILALNAAVEAARAGEHGRGFAVVASEVRSLAQRSADAAKEIKGLIGASVGKVDDGSRLVTDAGRTMVEIVASVQRVTDIIGEIAAAAVEQRQGIGQVNTAVAELDHMTQQNAALVEQSAAAAESLKDQAARLSGVVAAFRLEVAAA